MHFTYHRNISSIIMHMYKYATANNGTENNIKQATNNLLSFNIVCMACDAIIKTDENDTFIVK